MNSINITRKFISIMCYRIHCILGYIVYVSDAKKLEKKTKKSTYESEMEKKVYTQPINKKLSRQIVYVRLLLLFAIN